MTRLYEQVLHLMNRMDLPPPVSPVMDAPPQRVGVAKVCMAHEAHEARLADPWVRLPRQVQRHVVHTRRLKHIAIKIPALLPPTPPASRRLYVSNIASAVTRDRLLDLFAPYARRYVGVVDVAGSLEANTKRCSQAPDVQVLAGRYKGRAFVGFDSGEEAAAALRELNGVVLDGKPLKLVYSHHT